LLEEVSVPLYKLASAQIGTFPQIVEKVAALHKPTIFSTGIAAYDEIIKAVNIFKKYDNDQFIILHCNSIYPTPANKVNLRLIDTYKYMFGNPVGFSDHTDGIHIACAAVALGANVIEKHFTLDRNLNTPDCSSFASDPAEFKKLVLQIREIEAAKNSFNGRLEIQKEEKDFKNSILYRCVANSDIAENTQLELADICFLRNKEGIDARELPYLLQTKKKINKSIRKGDLIYHYDLIDQ